MEADIGRWVSLGIFVLMIIISLIVELCIPASFGVTTAVSLIPSAIIAGVLKFEWWLPIVEVLVACFIWVILYFLLFKIFKFNKKTTKQLDYVDQMLEIETLLLEDTTNLLGKNEFGKIKIDDKQYLVLPIDKETTIVKGSKVKIVKVDGNTCYVKQI